MPALKIVAIVCIIIFCFAIPVELVVQLYHKPKPPKIDKDGKRVLKINTISHWDYLIILLPAALLLIGLFSANTAESELSVNILGIGYAYLLLSSYNNRIVIPLLNKIIFTSCLTFAIIYCLCKYGNAFNISVSHKTLKMLLLPAGTYIYLLAARYIIKFFTKTFPITLDKTLWVNQYYNRYYRKITYWDLLWTICNFLGLPLVLVLYLTSHI